MKSKNELRRHSSTRYRRKPWQVWSLFYGDFVKDGKPVLTVLFTWDGETSTGDFAPPNDGIYCGWGDCAGIGVEKAAFLHDGDYLAFLILHELAHLRMGGGEGDGHDADFENQLQYLLSVYNDAYGTHLINDFAGYKGECSLKRDQKRADSMAVPASWVEIFKKAPSKSKESRSTQKHKTAVSGNSAQKAHRGDEKRRSTKKRKVAVSGDSAQKRKVAISDDSAQKARRDMIRQMQKGTEPKTSQKSKVQKSYNGVRRG
ncbi:MAG: hypothetical protein LUE89_06320 [Clostridiales bacterium]|nr:hypothetical protein [Clostridiales bacterium]